MVRSFPSLWYFISTTNEPYATFRPFGIFDLRMNIIVFVLYCLFISFAVDLIHFILYLNFVMSYWCLSDLPVSGQITASAIYGKRINLLLSLDFSSIEFLVLLKWQDNHLLGLLFQPAYLGTNYVAWHCVAP
jgi:hypothetical protein